MAPAPRRRRAALALLAGLAAGLDAGSAARAQPGPAQPSTPAPSAPVRLQLFDHVVGGAVLHNAPLPAGTEVFVVPRAEARAVRLRGGVADVAAALPGARRDRVGAGGRTEGTYAPTAAAGRALYVVARLPDGRLFQSYVRTGDAAWQPGYDAVASGRVSMGRVPDADAARLRAALPGPSAPAPAADTTRRPAADSAFGLQILPLDSADAAPPADAALAAEAAALLRADAALLADTTLDRVAAVPPGAVPVDDAPAGARPVLPWALGAGLAGALAAWAATRARYERLLAAQRAHLLPPRAEVPPAPTDAPAAEQSAADGPARALRQVELLQASLRHRDAEIERLRETLTRLASGAPEGGASEAGAPEADDGRQPLP